MFLFITGLAWLLSCGGGQDSPQGGDTDSFDVSFTLPSRLEASAGGLVTFSVNDGKAPLTSDIFMLTASSGVSTVCVIESVTATEFSVRLPSDIVSGTYQVYLRRGERRKSVGSVTINIVKSINFTPDKSSTVWGQVLCGEEGVPGVVVSDGVRVTVTDEQGIYQMNSSKKWGYVFISIPSGYEVPSDGILPKFWATLGGSASELERADFELTKVSGQDNYTMFFFGDMHLANRNSDRVQFQDFADDFMEYKKANGSRKMYAMTLGDMTWDLYWYDRSYSIPEYLDDINDDIQGIQVFHTIGNHDNDYKAFNDFDAAKSYVANLGPTFYSFNIGKIHYVALDDIDCSDYDGTTSRNYSKALNSEQLNWLRKDLEYVDKGTPVIIATHAQIFYPSASGGNWGYRIDHDAVNTLTLFNILDGYEAHFVTGHTHNMFMANTEQTSSLGASSVTEHNAGAVCASWWWSGHLTDKVYVSPDGTPAGYSIWDISGTDIKWRYKATGWDISHQIRAYDLNQISFSFDDVPDMPQSSNLRTAFGKYVDAYSNTSGNEVLINVWNWNTDWTLTVTDESGKELEWTQEAAYDPVHIAALSVKRFNSAGSSVPNFITENNMPHFFRVKASDADTDLTIRAVDEFGNAYEQKMSRPQAFSLDDYKSE